MPENTQNRKPGGAGRVFGVIGKVLGSVLLVILLTALIFSCLFAAYVKNDLSGQIPFSMEGFALDQTTVIYCTDPKTGEDLIVQKLYGGANRTWVKYEDIPSNLIHACVAIEDKRFFDHQGVDWITTLKACAGMFLGSSEAGGSTITQQLIKNLTGAQEITVRRKLVEIFRALEFEKQYTKTEILEWYLNIIGLGENCSGVQSAAQVYFGKNVEELSLAECASLIGITNNPSIYDPYIHPENNKRRQETILQAMLDQGYITQQQYKQAISEELVLRNASGDPEQNSGDYYTYFVDQVIRDVVNDLCEKTGYAYDIVYKMVTTGGYSIYCTMNPEVQQAMDSVYQDLAVIPKTASSQQLQSGMVVIDNATGDIVALCGGVGQKEGSLTYNRATMSRLSPGSTIKPISVYAPALELGKITPYSVYDDTPYSFADDKSWPKNQDNRYRGLVSVNEAVCQSYNTVAVKVLADITPEYAYSFAKDKMGLTTLTSDYVTASGDVMSDVNLSPLALGSLTNGVTVRAMTAAYAAFANQGVYREARTYTRVTDSTGKELILDNSQNSYVAMKDMTAWYITYMLLNTVRSGTGTAAKLENMSVAGKTGTTTSDFDRWFAGFTPYYTGVVWCGYDSPEEVVLTESQVNPAVDLWKRVMEPIHQGLENASFRKPTNVVECSICRDSGLLATDACKSDPRGSREIPVELSMYDVPTASCTVHKQADVCRASDHVANEFCPNVEGNTLYKAGLLDVVRGFPIPGITVLDQAYVLPDMPIPDGYYPAQSPDADSINVPCSVHTEQDLFTEEDGEASEEDTEKTDAEQSGASGFRVTRNVDTAESADNWNEQTGLNG